MARLSRVNEGLTHGPDAKADFSHLTVVTIGIKRSRVSLIFPITPEETAPK